MGGETIPCRWTGGESVRLISLDGSAVGERLIYELRDREGRVLLGAGSVLSGRHVELLRRRGYSSIPVNDPFAPDVTPEEPVRRELRQQAMALLTERIDQVESGGLPVTSAVRAVVDEILDDLVRNAALACNLLSLRSAENYLYVHSVNVCVYALMLSTALGLDRVDRKHIGIGALLHDLGMVFYKDLLTQPDALTGEQRAAIEGHTTIGFDIVRRQAEVDLRSAHVLLQHHERLDGSGYPRRLSGKQIHPWGQVVGVAEIFDTITSGRPYAQPRPAHIAIAALQEMGERQGMDRFLVRYFCERVAAYPNGTIVELATGEIGVVVAQRTGGPFRPVVRVLADRTHALISPEERLIDSATPGTTIVEVHDDYPVKMLADTPDASAM